MTVIRPNSVSGINSITAQADEIKVFKSNGTQGGLIIGGANLNATTGISTILALNVTGNVSIAGTLTYQDVTNVDSVGIITARSTIDAQGDVSIADKIVHTGDTNTSIRFPAADTITFETAGSERLRITSDGQLLHTANKSNGYTARFVQANSSNPAWIEIDSPADNNLRPAYIQLQNAGTNKWGIGQVYQSTSSGAFHIAAGAQNQANSKLTITTAGLIGIGDNSPDRKLHVNSGSDNECAIFESTDTEVTLEFKDTTGTASLKCRNDFRLNNSTGELLRIDSAGDIFIGTSTDIAPTNGTNLCVSDATVARLVLEKQSTRRFEIGVQDFINIYDHTADTERLRIASNGDIGLGTVPETDSYQPSLYFAGGNANIWGSGNANLYTAVNARYTGAGGWKYNNNGVASYVGQQSGVWNFFNAPSGTADATATFTERFRITSDGRIQANTQSAYSNEKFLFYFSGTHDNQDCFTIQNHNSYENTALIIKHGRGGLSGYSGKSISFRGNDNSEEGSIVIGTSSVAFNTSSDYRLKENQVAISDGITRLKTLKPYRFNFKKDTGTTVDGFFAHEVTAVPEAVSGEKDAMKKIYYEEGDTLPSGKNLGDFKEFSSTEISPQSMDHSKLVPLLTAALQEAITKIETLEQDNIDLRARVTNLEGN